MDNLLYWIWLSLSVKPGGRSFKKLYERFGSAEAIYKASEDEIASVIGSRISDYSLLCDKSLDKSERVLDFCRTKSVGILVFSDENYPALLREIKNPPVLLYYRGNLPAFNEQLLISVVGARRVSDYGRKNAFSVSRDLAKAGAVIASGMAVGIDGVALSAALSEGKATVAVIGSGIDVCYPPEHLRLAREIVKRGCVMTEYAPGVAAYKWNFPMRNRIISAISSATVVIEGRERSGSVITARSALSQGHRVFALPGNVGNVNSEAPNVLIKMGAVAFSQADDIVRELDKDNPGKLNPFKMRIPSSKSIGSVLAYYEVAATAPSDKALRPPVKQRIFDVSAETAPRESSDGALAERLSRLDGATRALYEKIPIGKGISEDALVSDEFPTKILMSALMKLEMAGLVTMLPGGLVKRCEP